MITLRYVFSNNEIIASFPNEKDAIMKECILEIFEKMIERKIKKCTINAKDPSYQFSRCLMYAGFEIEKKGGVLEFSISSENI